MSDGTNAIARMLLVAVHATGKDNTYTDDVMKRTDGRHPQHAYQTE
jgi:hypothetical protein